MLIANDRTLQILGYHPNDLAKGVRLMTNEEVGRGGGTVGLCLPDPNE